MGAGTSLSVLRLPNALVALRFNLHNFARLIAEPLNAAVRAGDR